MSNVFFNNRDNLGAFGHPLSPSQDQKDFVEAEVLKSYTFLTVGQRCADWFVLMQFRVTSTNARKRLMVSGLLRACVGMQSEIVEGERTPVQWLKTLYDWLFSSKVSIELMTRASANEGAVLKSMKTIAFLQDVYECGMSGIKSEDWLACCPDALALIDVDKNGKRSIEFSRRCKQCNCFRRTLLHLASVEIKTRVAPRTVDSALTLAAATIKRCDVVDERFRQFVPADDIGQLLHQVLVSGVQFIVYVVAAETGILYTVVLKCSQTVSEIFMVVVQAKAESFLSWAHTEAADIGLPAFADAELLSTLSQAVLLGVLRTTTLKRRVPSLR